MHAFAARRLDTAQCSRSVLNMEAPMDDIIAASRVTPDNDMPADIAALLQERGVSRAYSARLAYQQSDYIGWITRARRPDIRQKRLEQMLDELAKGGVYMHMKWNG
jgi:uncharacterized protein YdeI (YjbR/CyaY-like superfamily)